MAEEKQSNFARRARREFGRRGARSIGMCDAAGTAGKQGDLIRRHAEHLLGGPGHMAVPGDHPVHAAIEPAEHGHGNPAATMGQQVMRRIDRGNAAAMQPGREQPPDEGVVHPLEMHHVGAEPRDLPHETPPVADGMPQAGGLGKGHRPAGHFVARAADQPDGMTRLRQAGRKGMHIMAQEAASRPLDQHDAQ